MRSFWTGLTRALSSKPVLCGSTTGVLVFAAIIAILRLMIHLTHSEELYESSCFIINDSFLYYNPGFILFAFLFLGQLVADALLYFSGLGFLGTASLMGYAISCLPFVLVGVLVVSGRKSWAIVMVMLLLLGFVLSYWLSLRVVVVMCTFQTSIFH